MKRLAGVVLVLGLASSLLLYIPGAIAAPFAQGHVTGTVYTTGSLVEEVECVINPSDPGYTFSGVAIEGLFLEDGSNPNSPRYSGSIGVEDTRGRAMQCNTSGTTGDMGTVNCPAEWYENGDPTNPVSLTNGCTTRKVPITNFAPAHFDVTDVVSGARIVGLFYGTYLRDGPHVEVVLQVYSRINPPANWTWENCTTKDVFQRKTGPDGNNCPPGTVYVVAEFVPDIDADLGWSSAQFNGTWGSTKTWP